MVCQNSFLHVTTATYVLNGSNGDEIFESKKEEQDGYDGFIREWTMKAKTMDNTYLFHSVEKGRRG